MNQCRYSHCPCPPYMNTFPSLASGFHHHGLPPTWTTICMICPKYRTPCLALTGKFFQVHTFCNVCKTNHLLKYSPLSSCTSRSLLRLGEMVLHLSVKVKVSTSSFLSAYCVLTFFLALESQTSRHYRRSPLPFVTPRKDKLNWISAGSGCQRALISSFIPSWLFFEHLLSSKMPSASAAVISRTPGLITLSCLMPDGCMTVWVINGTFGLEFVLDDGVA